MSRLRFLLTIALCGYLSGLSGSAPLVQTGADRLAERSVQRLFDGKRVGLITNQTGINAHLESTISILKGESYKGRLVALFAPEHGLTGAEHADVRVGHTKEDGLPVYSLYGATRRPTDEMLKGIDLLVFDIQDVGTRSYTYVSTLFYVMEEAAKRGIPVVVLDRPNPINGVAVDGPMLHADFRSFVGYIDVPYCHGLTVGELARYFNGEYGIGCPLTVVELKGWKRQMTFHDTGLPWVPTSPHIPGANSPLYYPVTNLLGEILTDISVGVGYTLPFEVVGAPWIDGEKFADALNHQEFPGVRFHAFHFRPFFGRCAHTSCHGVKLVITDSTIYRPVSTQFLMLGVLKSLYPDHFAKSLQQGTERRQFISKIMGSAEGLRILDEERFIAWQLIAIDRAAREAFLKKREPYLLY